MAGPVERLKLINQSVFIPPADSANLVTACPTIDLTAAVAGGNVVYIRRRGGEIVSKVTERNRDVQALAWRSDGKLHPPVLFFREWANIQVLSLCLL
jgi:hypothetical protein